MRPPKMVAKTTTLITLLQSPTGVARVLLEVPYMAQ